MEVGRWQNGFRRQRRKMEQNEGSAAQTHRNKLTVKQSFQNYLKLSSERRTNIPLLNLHFHSS
jgi:hypothetical protein